MAAIPLVMLAAFTSKRSFHGLRGWLLSNGMKFASCTVRSESWSKKLGSRSVPGSTCLNFALSVRSVAANFGVRGTMARSKKLKSLGHQRSLHLELLEDRHVLATFFVTNLLDGPVSGPGSLPGSLRQAVYDANTQGDMDVIQFQVPGTIRLAGGGLGIRDSVDIIGLGGDVSIVDGSQVNSTVLYVSNDNIFQQFGATIRGLGITGGRNTSSGGGGIWNAENLTVVDSVISGNFAVLGGGIYNVPFVASTPPVPPPPVLTIIRSTISNNIAGGQGLGLRRGGGGIYGYRGSVTVTDSTIVGNSADPFGGGIHIEDGTLTVTRTTIQSNTAEAGGGLHYEGIGPAIIKETAIVNNRADFGGGIHFSWAKNVQLVNSTVSGNTALSEGGGVNNNNGNVTILNSTITANNAPAGMGSGIAAGGGTGIGSSIVSGNANGDIDGGFNDIGFNIIGTVNGLPGGITNPRLAPLADNGGSTLTHALLPDSPAIDTGDNPLNLTTDQRGDGYERLSGLAVDAGAFELQVAAIDTLLSDNEVEENLPAETLVGTFTTVDSSPGNTYTYLLVAGTGDDDNASFAIVADQLQTAAVFDFEAKNTYSIRLQTVDQDGRTFDKVFGISITDVNEMPMVGADFVTVRVDEGQSALNSGTYSDPENNVSMLSASIGMILDNLDGTWGWSFDTDDGPDQSLTVTISVTDSGGLMSTTTFELMVDNAAPILTADSSTVTVDEGDTATNHGGFSDPGDDSVMLSTSVGVVMDNGDGSWSWSFGTTDGPDQTQTVTITATDSDGAVTMTAFELVVENAGPSLAVDMGMVVVAEGSPEQPIQALCLTPATIPSTCSLLPWEPPPITETERGVGSMIPLTARISRKW